MGIFISKIGRKKTSPLMSAVFNDDIEMAALLLEYGADPSVKDSEGYTAYDYAKDFENIEMPLLK
ncbi:ankyrin repeat domain-containing protein [Cytobacillus firmus]|uniref:ankyrin repeat domain-containing protein n=1 Tax=Cytobacillus firmus TaxID=1399 RepID=UPI00288C2DCE|nr:ankyrin repeat domain-containing protein [Cytobacillus firmus]